MGYSRRLKILVNQLSACLRPDKSDHIDHAKCSVVIRNQIRKIRISYEVSPEQT